jgi:hypothetical protein
MNSSPTAVKDAESVEASSTTGRDSEPATTPLPIRSTKDERRVRGARLTVMAALLLSAVTIAALQYVLLTKSEHSSFEAQVCTHTRLCQDKCGTLQHSTEYTTDIAHTLFLVLATSSKARLIKSSSWPTEMPSTNSPALPPWRRSIPRSLKRRIRRSHL